MFRKIVSTAAVCAVLASTFAAQTSFHYPEAKRTDQVDDFHGVKVADPYRWMEQTDSPEMKSWIEAENKITDSYISSIPQRGAIKNRLTEIWNYERYGAPSKITDRFYVYTKNDGLQNQSVWYRAKSIDDQNPAVFFDPNKLRADGTAALSGYSFTQDGKYWAYSISEAGSDRQTWRVRDVASGNDLPDTFGPLKFTGVSWMRDDSGFFYSRYPEWEKSADLKSESSFEKLYFHKLGTPQSEDKLVYERPDNKEYFVSGGVSEDGRWLVINVGKGTENMNMVYAKDLSKNDSPIVPIIENLDNSWSFLDNNGSTMYFITDKDAPRSRIVKIDVLGDKKWSEVIPESKDTIDGVSILDNDKIVVTYMQDAHTAIKIYDTKGNFIRDVQLPGIGSASGFGGRRGESETFYTYSSFNAPPTIYRYDMKTGKSTIFRQAKTRFDGSQYEVKQVFYTSKDGTRVPMFLTYKKGIKLDGTNPTLLYGYGGFNSAETPYFSISRAIWLEMGGVYAVANIRGGNEYGSDWWKGGSRLNKQNVFDDFAWAGKWLIDNKYTSTPKLAINGASNGGLLVGATLNQHPDWFGAAVPQVGVMDMLRFDKFTIGWAWRSDYGDPTNDADFKAMYAYSPLHNAKPGTKYPPVLITTSDHDDRVFPAHSFKYTAAMQYAQAADNPILIRVQTRGGHGAGLPTTAAIEQQADIYAFLVKALNMKGL
jgi:prolyl oligopeptidase